MNSQYRKNLKAVATACKNYTDETVKQAFSDYSWYIGTHNLSPDDDNSTAYTKTVPSGAIKCVLNKVGSMSYNYNQLYRPNEEVLGTTIDGITFTNNNDGTFTLNGTATANITKDMMALSRTAVGNSIVLYGFVNLPTAITGLKLRNQYTFFSTNTTRLETITNSQLSFAIVIDSGTVLNNVKVAVECINLTQIFGAGNEPSDVASAIPLLQARGYKLNGTDEYNTGTIRDSPVTSVVSKDSNDTTLDTFTIPAEVQAQNGYGWGINDTCYNYIYYDITRKKWFYVQKVGRVDLSTLNWSNFGSYSKQSDSLSTLIKKPSSDSVKANILSENYTEKSRNTLDNYGDIAVNSNGTFFVRNNQEGTPSGYLYYELATPVETDISEYIEDNIIEVEASGTLEFTNTYSQAVPSDIDYLIEEVKS